MISDKVLQEYKKIYKEKFGKNIDDATAMEQATKLLTLMNVVYRPIKKEWAEEYNKKDEKGLK
jgi:hypothetical protein